MDTDITKDASRHATKDASQDRRSAGRPRDPRIEQALLAAVRDLLTEGGYAAVTVAAVADRAGTTSR